MNAPLPRFKGGNALIYGISQQGEDGWGPVEFVRSEIVVPHASRGDLKRRSQAVFACLNTSLSWPALGNIDARANVSSKLIGSCVTGNTLGKQPAVLTIGTLQAVFQVACFTFFETVIEDTHTAFAVVGMNVLDPATPHFLFEGPSRELKPVAIEEVSLAIGAGHPNENRGSVGHDAKATFTFTQSRLSPFALGNVLRNFRDADYLTLAVSNRGDGERNKEPSSVLGLTDSFVVPDALALPQAPQNLRFLIEKVGRDDQSDGLPNHFFSGVSKDALSAGVPAFDDPVQVFRDNRVFRTLHDGSQAEARQISLLPGVDILDEGDEVLQLARRIPHCRDSQVNPDEGSILA